MMQLLRIPLIIAILWMTTVTHAQGDDTCSAIADHILSEVNELCADTGRNQVCYGYAAIEASARQDTERFQFDQPGDIVDAAAIQSLKLSPLSPDHNTWGVALMRLQTSMPDARPDQFVTFVLFGGVELTNAVSVENRVASPLQAFYLTTSGDQTRCASQSPGGLLVQTPRDAGEVFFMVNGVRLSLGSTVYFRVSDERQLSVYTLEGAAMVTQATKSNPIPAGTQLSIPLGDDLLPAGDPTSLGSLDAEDIDTLPLTLLDPGREYADPLDDEALAYINEHFENDGELCGDYPLPSCEDYPWLQDWEPSELQWGEDGFGDMAWSDAGEEYDDIEYTDAEYDDAEYIDGEYDGAEYDDTEFDETEFDETEFDETEFDESEYDETEFDESEYDGTDGG